MILADKQREELIKERGEPVLKLDFDVFENNKISMWTHFNHSDNFNETKQRLILIKNHLEEFIRDASMCPFNTKNNQHG